MTPASEIINDKLNTVSKADICDLARELGVSPSGSHGVIVSRLLNRDPAAIDAFIKRRYHKKVKERQANLISDAELLGELAKVERIDWGVVQGQLDAKIQSDYVRKFVRYDDLVAGVRRSLHDTVTGYAIASWYNHWSTVLIEDHISQHPNVVPTLKNVRGVDVFLGDHPFDLKITYLPKGYDMEEAITDPIGVARWLYENQGAQRFGDDNRFYVVLINRADVAQSWKLKREMSTIAPQIDAFLDSITVSSADVLSFIYNNRSYTAKCKTLVVTGDV